MKFGFVVPWADAAEIGELAAVAELHGWDGLFVWEPVWGVDAWVALAVAACRTSTASSRHDADTAAAPQAVGAGRPGGDRRPVVERTSNRQRRARRTGQRLRGVRRGDRQGRSRRTARRGSRHHPRPVGGPAVLLSTASTTRSSRASSRPSATRSRQPGVPIWCVGALGSKKSMSRALSCDGLIPQVVENGSARQCTLEELQQVATSRPAIRRHRRRSVERTLPRGMGRRPEPRGGWRRCGALSAIPMRSIAR